MIVAALLMSVAVEDVRVKPAQIRAPVQAAPKIAPDFATADIEQLLIWVMMQVSKEAEADLRATLQDMKTSLEEKKRLREELAAMKRESERVDNGRREARDRQEAAGWYQAAKTTCGKISARTACLIDELRNRNATLKLRTPK